VVVGIPTRKTNEGRPPTVTASGSEEHQEVRIPEGRNTRSHLAIRKSDRPCGNIVRRNITIKCRDFK